MGVHKSWITLLLIGISASAAAEAPPCKGTPLRDNEVNFETIEAKLGSLATSPADIVACLPKSYRDRFALIRDSNSLQSASDQAPRVLMYGSDGRTLLTFNGDKPGTIEVIEYREGPAGTPPVFEPRKIDFALNGPNRFQTHPRGCTTCHVNGPNGKFKPIWEAYDTWPGTYGSLSSLGRDYMPKGECAEYKKFRQTVTAPGFDRSSPYASLELQETKDGGNGGCLFDPGVDGARASPTGHLNHLLSGLVVNRALAELKCGGHYPPEGCDTRTFNRYRFALLSAALGCDQIEKGVGAANALDAAVGRVPGKDTSDVRRQLKAYFDGDRLRRIKSLGQSGEYAAICQRPHDANTYTNGEVMFLLAADECPACAATLPACRARCGQSGAYDDGVCESACFEACNRAPSCKSLCRVKATHADREPGKLLFKNSETFGTVDFDQIASFKTVTDRMGVNLGDLSVAPSSDPSSRENEYAFADGLGGIRNLGGEILSDPAFTRGIPFLDGAPAAAPECFESVADYVESQRPGSQVRPQASICGSRGVRKWLMNPPEASGAADPFFATPFGNKKRTDCEQAVEARVKACEALSRMSEAALSRSTTCVDCSEQAAKEAYQAFEKTASSATLSARIVANTSRLCAKFPRN